MPQILAVVSKKIRLTEKMYYNIESFDTSVEKHFDIIGRNDVAITIVRAVRTKKEADIQIEIRYTAGTDEYGTGKIFDPSAKVKKRLSKEIAKRFHLVYPKLSLSVWCRPSYRSYFEFYPALI